MKFYFGFLLILGLFLSSEAESSVLSPSARELNFDFEASFLASETELFTDEEVWQTVERHAQHLFGILGSKHLSKDYGFDPKLVEGVGIPRVPMNFSAVEVTPVHSDIYLVHYRARGRLLVHKDVARTWLKNGGVTLPMIYDYPTFLNEYENTWVRCTDPNFSEPQDFWYFHDPFQLGCEALTRSPISRPVRIHVTSAVSPGHMDTTLSRQHVPLERLRGDNRNGRIFSIYLFFTFDEDASSAHDEGRVEYEYAVSMLSERYGLSLEYEDIRDQKEEKRFIRNFESASGDAFQARFFVFLMEAETPTFRSFWQEGIFKGDVVIYEGHSGMGANLATRSLGNTLGLRDGSIRFPQNKQQLIFLDACSSYAWYLDMYQRGRKESQIDIISYGLSSYFDSATPVLSVLFDHLLGLDDAPRWIDVLQEMEDALGGPTYLINAGAL